MEELKEKRAADQKALRKLYAKKGLCTGIYFAAAALIEIVTFGVLGFGGAAILMAGSCGAHCACRCRADRAGNACAEHRGFVAVAFAGCRIRGKRSAVSYERYDLYAVFARGCQ